MGTNSKVGFNESEAPDKFYGTFETLQNGEKVQLNKAVIVDSEGNEVAVAKDGTDIAGATMPTGGVGIRGWLSAIFQKLSSTLAVSGTVSVSNFPATQTVSATALPLPTGAATEETLAAIKTATEKVNTNTLVGGKMDGVLVTSLEQLLKTLIAEQRVTNYLLQNEFSHNNEDDIELMRIEILAALNK
jgi:hypothetical protein